MAFKYFASVFILLVQVFFLISANIEARHNQKWKNEMESGNETPQAMPFRMKLTRTFDNARNMNRMISIQKNDEKWKEGGKISPFIK